MTTPTVMIFYPFFPVYRRAILAELEGVLGSRLKLIATTRSKAGIPALQATDIPHCRMVAGIRIGPTTYECVPLINACSRQIDWVVVAPATLSITTWIILLVRRLRGLNTALWGQCGKPGARGPKRLVQELMNRLASRLLVYGQSEADGATELGTSLSKCRIVGNASGLSEPTDEAKFDGSRWIRPNTASDRWPTIAYVGRITAPKQLDTLVHAVAIVAREHRSAHLSLVGDGEALPDILALAHELGVSTSALGSVYDKSQLADYFSEVDLVVSPQEIGLLAIDALSHRKIVIYPDNPRANGPEASALVDNINAVRVHPGKSEDIAAAILASLSPNAHWDWGQADLTTLDALPKWSPSYVASRIIESLKD